ncbi:MAG: hypothetical protein KME10_22090 [Plectolyngbya sp. WJT66-NPBG17]|jgi:hypothetical protein|nr:hypothetical protein [Plectolyngbya sp. WJT66-NPBG17]
MNQVVSLDMVRDLALHRLSTAQEDIEELLAGGATLDDLAESGVCGTWKSSEEKAQTECDRAVEKAALLQALTEFEADELGCEEF